MIVQKEFLNKLKDFGLNSYESKLWTALLSRGISTAGELSDIAGVPRSRSYDVLESLEKKGFIIMKLGKPIKYIAVPPSEVIERVKKKIEEDSEKQVKMINALREGNVLEELNLLHREGVEFIDPVELSGSIKGRNNLYNHLESMIKNADSNISIMTTAAGLIRKSESLKSAFEKAKKKGVRIKIAAPLNKQTEKAAKELARYAEIRNADERARFCVIDGKEIMFMLLDDDKVHPSYDSGVWINTKFFAATLDNFFENCWSKMKPADKYMKAE